MDGQMPQFVAVEAPLTQERRLSNTTTRAEAKAAAREAEEAAPKEKEERARAKEREEKRAAAKEAVSRGRRRGSNPHESSATPIRAITPYPPAHAHRERKPQRP